LREGRAADRPVILGSVKSNIGHLQAAAGVAGLIKVLLAFEHDEIPRHLHFREPNPYIPWSELPVKVAAEPVSWRRGERRRLAGVSSFGFSGTNAHVVLEEAPAARTVQASAAFPVHLLTASAASEPALKETVEQYAHVLLSSDAPLLDVCFTANAGRAQLAHRVAVLGATAAQTRDALEAALRGDERRDVFRGHVEGADRPKIAFLFTGQGSQSAGMGRQLYETQPV